jgi:HEAT repeat protein
MSTRRPDSPARDPRAAAILRGLTLSAALLLLPSPLPAQVPPPEPPPAEPLAQALETLKARLVEEKEKPYAERVRTIATIGMLQTDEAVAVLAGLFTDEKDEYVRSAALYALAGCATPRAGSFLQTAVRDAALSTRCRVAALDALVRSRKEASFDLTFAVARDTKADNDLRGAAFAALATYPLARTEAIWREALESGPAVARILAYHALAPLKDRTVLGTARKAIESPVELSEVRAAAVAPWKTAAGPEGTRLLLSQIGTTDQLLRAAIADALASLTNENDISLLFPVLAKHPDSPVRALMAGALGKPPHPGAVGALQEALKDKDADVRLAALESLGQRPEPKAEEILSREAQGSSEDMAVAAIGALGGRASETTLKLLAKLAESPRLPIAAAAIDALGDRAPADALPVLAKALRHTSAPVRAAAARALRSIRTRESIDLLVERLGQEDGRLRGDIVDALRALTGRDLPYDAAAWKTWWQGRRETFDPSAPLEKDSGGNVNTVAYYGIPVLSKRVVFCLDISSSMSATAEDGLTRMEQAKRELSRTLGSLESGVHLNIIFFDNKIQPVSRALFPIKGHLPSTLKTVAQAQPRGSTNIYDTLETAFSDSTVDTVFLLSDGEPTDGKYISTEEILRRIRRVNRTRGIVIHTISFGKSEFMKALAEQNGGRYVEKP